MDKTNSGKIWQNPTKKIVDSIIEEGISILKQGTQKSLKEFEAYIKEIIGEKEIIR